MSRRPRFSDDRRAIAANVSHVLAIGIASLLVVTLLFAANSYLADQQETAVRQGLESVGNNIANELTMLDGLQASKTDVSMQASHPDRIAGSSYSVRIEHGSECDVPTITTESCVILESVTPELTEYVPLQNETNIEISQGTQGRFRYVSEGSSRIATRAGPDRAVSSLRASLQLGIGENVSEETFGSTDGGVTNVPPVATFRTDPSYPSVGSDITFVAYDDGIPGASDPDGDDSKLYYRWDFDDDGNWDRNGTGQQTTVLGGNSEYFDSPGVYNVTLNVTDRNGNGRSTYVSRNISVSGLELVGGFSIGCSGDCILFDMRNQWASYDIEITGIYINATTPGVTFETDWVGIDDDGDNYVEWIRYDPEVTERGVIIPEGSSVTNPATFGPGQLGTVGIVEPDPWPENEPLRIVIEHTVNGRTNATSFEATAPPEP
ncbi:PKD domain-containing protein [Halorientalis pallida]|uniref:PKD domain-containing protein n=1 Tax=Halorientalis pallida TaxID=2479928 RepID=UPI003C6F5A79